MILFSLLKQCAEENWKDIYYEQMISMELKNTEIFLKNLK